MNSILSVIRGLLGWLIQTAHSTQKVPQQQRKACYVTTFSALPPPAPGTLSEATISADTKARLPASTGNGLRTQTL
ncbi:MAG: hypothetical protein OXC07_06255 [Kistimonas sp.]|nr:hypothetical protein [Kistimonas sp.]